MLAFARHTAMAATLLLALATPTRADEIMLKFATLSTSDGPLNARMLHPWAERVNVAGKGVVQLDVRDGFAIANYNNIYDRVLDDVVQVAFTVTGSIAGKFALSDVVDLPFLFDRPDDASVAYWRLYKSGALDSEYTEIVPLYLVTLANSGLHLDRAPPAPDDIRGLKIVASSKITADIVTALGGTPISLQQNDMYTALQRHAVDGTYGAWTSFPAFKLGEVTNYHIEAKLGGAPAMVFMAKKRFDALPAAAQKLLMDNSGEAASRRFGEYWMNLDNEVRQQYRQSPGHTIAELTPAQRDGWRAKLEPIDAQWQKDTPGGRAVLAKYRALLGEVESEHR
ncbi:MAG TPA: TRAP transporter substrate-binding protein [Stellaceae bacterium]|jgi:TRAP-type C4-dicarboxylate transport system substrate-binding protein